MKNPNGCGMFNAAVGNSDHMESNYQKIYNEWTKNCNYILLLRNLRTGIEKNHENPLEGQESLCPVSFRARHRSGAYRIFLSPVLSTLPK
jgi:hypothetical protein